MTRRAPPLRRKLPPTPGPPRRPGRRLRRRPRPTAGRSAAAEEARAAAKPPAPPPRKPPPPGQPRRPRRRSRVRRRRRPPLPRRPRRPRISPRKGLGREAAPVVDGQPADGAWQSAPPLSFEVAGASGKMTVTVAALWSPDRLWILVRWPDKTRDDVHRPWVWSKAEKAYVAGREVEDALVALVRAGRADGRVHARGQRGGPRTCGPGAPGARTRRGSPRTRR